MSRYKIEWTNGLLPEGTELFAAPQAPVPEHTWVDTTWRATVAQAVYNQVRREINNFIGPWSAFDVDEQQRIVDAIKTVMPAPPVQEPEISDAQASLLASALGECILASGIVGKDKDGFSGPELLMFAEDLKQMLERSRQPVQEPVAVNQIRLGYGRWSDISDVELKIFAAKDGWELRTLYAAPRPRKAVKLTEAEIHNADPMPHGMSDTHRMAFGQAIETAVLAKNGLEL